MSIDTTKFKKKLEDEKKLLEGELGGIGRKVPGKKGDWEATPVDVALNASEADPNEVADEIEEFEERVSTEGTLESRLADVKAALSRIKNGTYGVCTVGGEEIELARLEANPSALTCKKHLR